MSNPSAPRKAKTVTRYRKCFGVHFYRNGRPSNVSDPCLAGSLEDATHLQDTDEAVVEIEYRIVRVIRPALNAQPPPVSRKDSKDRWT